MRRASSTLASSALSRSLLPGRADAIQHRFVQAALYGTTTSSTSRRWFSTAIGSISGRSARTGSLGIAGALVFVAGSASLLQEAFAKEIPSGELVPKDVVLYQYEACPFCNKVKGSFTLSSIFIYMLLSFWN